MQLYFDVGSGALAMDETAQIAVMNILFETMYGNNTLTCLNTLCKHWESRWLQAMKYATDDLLEVAQTVDALYYIRLKVATILLERYENKKDQSMDRIFRIAS